MTTTRDTIVGREAELREVDRFLDEIRERAGALVLEGEPGIGKTTVWREGVRLAEARGYLVLQCRPAEGELNLSFSGLADLVEPLGDDVFEALTEPQRYALDVALLRVMPGEHPPDPRALGAGFRSLVSELALAQPVVIAVDDAQWLDRASAQAIEFGLRRITGAPVGLLASRRPGKALDSVIRENQPVLVGPLSVAAIHHAIKHGLGHTLPRPLLVRIHAAAGGNPFYALEIARVAAESGVRPSDPLPIPSDLSELVLRRLERLSATTRDVLLSAAAVASPTRSLLTALHDGEATHALEESAAAGIVVSPADEDVRFVHPLYAAAVYSSAPPAGRRSAHARLAEAATGQEEQARHLALATDGVDEATAALVHAAAGKVASRGAPATAAELVEHALRLGAPGSAAAFERTVDLAEYAHTAGDSPRARELLERVVGWEDAPVDVQVRARLLLLELHYWTTDYMTAIAIGERLLEETDAVEVRAAVHAKLAEISETDMKRGALHADAALELLEELGGDADPNVHALALATRARNRLALGHGLERELVERAIELEARGPSRLIAHSYGQWLKYVDDLDGARRRLLATLRDAEESGDETSVPNIMQQLAVTECWAGNLALAREHAARACELAEELGLVSVGTWRIRSLVEAHLGDEPEVRAIAERLTQEGWELGTLVILEVALGLLELSLSNPSGADVHLRRALAGIEQTGQIEPGVHRVHADAAEAALALGDRERAQQIARLLEEHGRRTAHLWSQATGARCRALLAADQGDLAAALAALDEALAAHERLRMPYELARTLLARGQVERRLKRKNAAKASFERALALFVQIGAELWAERARTELARVGLRRAPGDELTETERRIAELAASGMTNREIAQAAFVSPKTVEANLARVYRKLGIRSRAELGAHMGSRSAQT